MSADKSVAQQEHLELSSISDGDNALVSIALVEQNLLLGDREGLAVNSEFNREFGVARCEVELSAFFGLEIPVIFCDLVVLMWSKLKIR
jgi:hypothetical protein